MSLAPPMPQGDDQRVHSGPIHSSVAGRTDHLPMHVASGSYVIPADIISAMGEGNSLAGFKVAASIFSAPSMVGGTPPGATELPYDPDALPRAAGGSTGGSSAKGGSTSSKSGGLGGYSGLKDMFDGGGKGASGSSFKGGLASDALNTLGVRPIGSSQPNTGGYSGLNDMFDGGGAGASGSSFQGGPYSAGLNTLGIRPAGSTQPNTGGYTGVGDMFDGGGAGAAGSSFQGGPYSMALNTVGIQPAGSAQPNTGNGYLAHIGLGGAAPAKAAGGATEAIPIIAAGGEYVIGPDDVIHVGNGSLENGHKILDHFVKKMRQKTIKTLQRLPGPKRD